MNFGRAALLGLAGGENYCDNAYPRCPRNEEDLLFYLNNHRGGFFRFFNGGSGFGDENQLQSLQQNPQNYGSNTDQGLNILAFQALANAINQGGGINLGGGNRPSQNYQSDQSGGLLSPSTLSGLLSSFGGGGSTNQADQSSGILSSLGPGALSTLASNLGFGTKRPTQGSIAPSQTQSSGGLDSSSLSSLVSNLLTGVIGNRYSRRSKRSTDQIEPRILNLKPHEIAAEQNYYSQTEQFFNRGPKFFEDNSRPVNNIRPHDSFVIPNNPRETVIKSDLHNVKLTFPADNEPQNIKFESNNNIEYLSPQDVAKKLQILFDRTGTGSLGYDYILDNPEMMKQIMTIIRLGRILNGIQQPLFVSPSQNQNQNQNYIDRYSSNQKYSSSQYTGSNQYTPNRYSVASYNQVAQSQPNRYSSTSNYNQNYQSQRYTPNYSTGSNYNRQNEDNSHLVYITNSQGTIEYTLNEKTGEKKRYY
jgi:hypothetical protein